MTDNIHYLHLYCAQESIWQKGAMEELDHCCLNENTKCGRNGEEREGKGGRSFRELQWPGLPVLKGDRIMFGTLISPASSHPRQNAETTARVLFLIPHTCGLGTNMDAGAALLSAGNSEIQESGVRQLFHDPYRAQCSHAHLRVLLHRKLCLILLPQLLPNPYSVHLPGFYHCSGCLRPRSA